MHKSMENQCQLEVRKSYAKNMSKLQKMEAEWLSNDASKAEAMHEQKGWKVMRKVMRLGTQENVDPHPKKEWCYPKAGGQ